MKNEFKEELIKLATKSQSEIGMNENNVKYKFINPFLKCFGFKEDLDFEHESQRNSIDIYIENIGKHRIVIETKAYDKNLDEFIIQLKKYCDDKRPILAIIANGKEIRFYSPLSKITEFSETLLYSFKRVDLGNEDIILRLEKILSKENYVNDNIDDNIDEREKEIKVAKKEIKLIENSVIEKKSAIENDINDINEQITILQHDISKKQQEISKIEELSLDEIKKTENQYCIIFKNKENKILSGDPQIYIYTKGAGNSDVLEEQIIPVIKLVLKNGKGFFNTACKEIASKIINKKTNKPISNRSVLSNCTRGLKLSGNDDFLKHIEHGTIKEILKMKYNNRIDLINNEL
ncbi:MAG: hypothetical protein WCL51_08870 [Bacteroidota bacterium]